MLLIFAAYTIPEEEKEFESSDFKESRDKRVIKNVRWVSLSTRAQFEGFPWGVLEKDISTQMISLHLNLF